MPYMSTYGNKTVTDTPTHIRNVRGALTIMNLSETHNLYYGDDTSITTDTAPFIAPNAERTFILIGTIYLLAPTDTEIDVRFWSDGIEGKG